MNKTLIIFGIAAIVVATLAGIRVLVDRWERREEPLTFLPKWIIRKFK